MLATPWCHLLRCRLGQAFGIVLALVLYQLVLVHSASRHHMLLFTSFLGLPSATLRTMAARPCLVRP